ncbi:unnamed protein product [Trypanosoma congolense IL3000]|uniref:WGS project CAEQ00000000 data, annotated contig 1002 n=1 Tax=Trypanosoma congolense (strain IL3000) TaxID=1068625 RepID=F9W355_TRYCI|nr:unnamed protein product [Trypanosoma congolense IL3000]
MVFPEKQSIAFGVRHPVSLTDEDIDKALGTCLFRNTLRLFALKTDGTQCGTTLPLTTADSTVPSACNREDFSTFDSPESNHLQPKKREAYDVSDGFTSTDGTEPLQMPLNINNEQCAASYHRVKLTGNRWSHVCTKNRAAFDEALGSDICSVLNLPRGSVENITVSQQDQTVSFVVRRPVALRESSIDSALWTCTFKRTLGLYNFSAANDLSRIAPPALKISDSAYEGRRIRNISPRNADIVVTEHHVKFSGDGWWDVFSRRRAEFVEAFETDLCKALDLPRGSVGDVHLDLSGQSVSFRVHHPASLHKAGITRLIYTCPFKDTLQVYIKPPTVEQSQVTSLTSGTSKDVLEQFPGGYITPPALRALPTAPDSHPNLGIDRRYDGTVVTHHRVKFEGDGWADVFNDERAAFNHAFRMDVCEALQLPYDKITNITTFDDNQIVNFDVCHPRAMEMHNIVTAINMCPFKRTVGLYSSLHKGTGYKLLPALEDYESSTNNNVSKDYQYRNHTPQNEDEGRKFAGIMCYGTSHDKNQGVTDDSSSYQGNDQQRNRGEYPSKTNEEKQGQLLTPDALRHPLLKNDNESASELKFKNTDDTHDMPPQEKRGQCKPNTITHSYKIDSRLQDSLVVPPAPETSDVASPKQRDSLVVPPAPETSDVASPKQRDSLVVPPAPETSDVAAPKQRDSLVVPPALEAMDVAAPKQRDSLVVPPALEAMDVRLPSSVTLWLCPCTGNIGCCGSQAA